MSALTWNEDGIIRQQLFKYHVAACRAVAQRAAAKQRRERPDILADESQYFVNSFDAEFPIDMSLRSRHVRLLTKSLPTYYAKMGGENPAKHKADMLLANFVTRCFTTTPTRKPTARRPILSGGSFTGVAITAKRRSVRSLFGHERRRELQLGHERKPRAVERNTAAAITRTSSGCGSDRAAAKDRAAIAA